jgi:hypothetical protein
VPDRARAALRLRGDHDRRPGVRSRQCACPRSLSMEGDAPLAVGLRRPSARFSRMPGRGRDAPASDWVLDWVLAPRIGYASPARTRPERHDDRLLAGGSRMARPGLEPGTPRFSVVTSRALERGRIPGNRGIPARRRGRGGCSEFARVCARFGGRVALCPLNARAANPLRYRLPSPRQTSSVSRPGSRPSFSSRVRRVRPWVSAVAAISRSAVPRRTSRLALRAAIARRP